jgi:hypothetical protein
VVLALDVHTEVLKHIVGQYFPTYFVGDLHKVLGDREVQDSAFSVSIDPLILWQLDIYVQVDQVELHISVALDLVGAFVFHHHVSNHENAAEHIFLCLFNDVTKLSVFEVGGGKDRDGGVLQFE